MPDDIDSIRKFRENGRYLRKRAFGLRQYLRAAALEHRGFLGVHNFDAETVVIDLHVELSEQLLQFRRGEDLVFHGVHLVAVGDWFIFDLADDFHRLPKQCYGAA